MNIIEEKTKQIELIPRSDTFNMYLSNKIEDKIQFICNKIWNKEWSGILFYTVKGNFKDNNLVIKPIDIYIMDIGNTSFTEFDVTADIMNYMIENNLIDCFQGLIHSHHRMSTFFSGTDTNTLKEEGSYRNHFVSLIVNNSGNYSAAITRKIITDKVITSTISYNTFEDKKITSKGTKIVKDLEELEYYYLKIIKENNTKFTDIDNRLQEIIEEKKVKSLQLSDRYFQGDISKHWDGNQNTFQFNGDYNPLKTTIHCINKKENNVPNNKSINIDNKDNIDSIVLQLLTGSIIVTNSNKFDKEKWINSMASLFNKRFGKENLDTFKDWADPFIDFICFDNIEDENKQHTINSIITELSNLNKSNIYIDYYIEYLTELSDYV